MSSIFDGERKALHYMTAGVIVGYMASILSAVAGYAYENDSLRSLAYGLAVGSTGGAVVTGLGRFIFFD